MNEECRTLTLLAGCFPTICPSSLYISTHLPPLGLILILEVIRLVEKHWGRGAAKRNSESGEHSVLLTLTPQFLLIKRRKKVHFQFNSPIVINLFLPSFPCLSLSYKKKGVFFSLGSFSIFKKPFSIAVKQLSQRKMLSVYHWSLKYISCKRKFSSTYSQKCNGWGLTAWRPTLFKHTDTQLPI